jgi:ADP-ribosylglycohydrolase
LISSPDIVKEGVLMAVNLGDDADTTGAVYGQLAGAYYGEQGIPEAWLAKLADREVIERSADLLLELSLQRGQSEEDRAR